MITVSISIELKGLDTVHRNGNALTNEIGSVCKKSRAQKKIQALKDDKTTFDHYCTDHHYN